MIKYKVVTEKRESIIIPSGSKFCLTYHKGTIVKALPETLGIMVFKNLYYAKKFNTFSGIIIKVRPIGKKKSTPYNIAATVYNAMRTTSMIKAYNQSAQVHKTPTPSGTQCYTAVEVL